MNPLQLTACCYFAIFGTDFCNHVVVVVVVVVYDLTTFTLVILL